MKIEVTSKGEINPNDHPFLSEEPKIIIGKDDQSISLLELGKLINILPQLEYKKIDSNSAYFRFPIAGGLKLLIQVGRVDVPPGSTTFNFHEPYVDTCLAVYPGLSFTSSDTTIVKADKVSNEQFKIRNTDPTVTARTYWLSIGV